MIIKKGSTVYPSERGHYNFHYPKIDEKYTLNMDIDVEVLHWRRPEGLIPVEVVSPKNYLPYTVLWTEKPV